MTTGYVYAIKSPHTDCVYIGSTTYSLNHRFNNHKSDYKRKIKMCKASEIIDYGDAFIELIEEIIYKNKSELLQKESYYITNMKSVNKVVPIKQPNPKQSVEYVLKEMEEYDKKWGFRK